MQETSRNKLLRALLHAREPLHVRQLKKYLGTSTNAVYKQVNALEHRGFIERGENIHTKGRPGRLYQLTSKGRSSFLKQYVLFANLIVDELKNCFTSCQVQKYFSKLGQTLASNFMYRVDRLEKVRKIKEVEVIMQDLGYEASSIYQDSNDDVILANNCVFQDIVNIHPEVCLIDIYLISSLLGAKVELRDSIALGGKCCRFFVQYDQKLEEDTL